MSPMPRPARECDGCGRRISERARKGIGCPWCDGGESP